MLGVGTVGCKYCRVYALLGMVTIRHRHLWALVLLGVSTVGCRYCWALLMSMLGYIKDGTKYSLHGTTATVITHVVPLSNTHLTCVALPPPKSCMYVYACMLIK